MAHRSRRSTAQGLVGAVAFAAVALIGCGKSDPPPAAAPSAAKAAAVAAAKTPARSETASAEQVAKEARGDLRCPPQVGTPARDAKAPVDDIVGVRPGLRYQEAADLVACTNELLVVAPESGRGFDLKTYGQTLRQGFGARFAQAREIKSSKQILQEMQRDAMARGSNAVREDLQPGQAKWFVGTMGMPGEEQVLSVAREERYAADQSPTVDGTRDALQKKYGAPTLVRVQTGQPVSMRWAYDPLGRPVSETSPLFGRCVGSASPDAGVNLAPECGIVVEALLIPQRNNADLVERLQVGVVDKAGGYKLLTTTEQGLLALDQQRRNQEVAKAAKNGKSPSL